MEWGTCPKCGSDTINTTCVNPNCPNPPPPPDDRRKK